MWFHLKLRYHKHTGQGEEDEREEEKTLCKDQCSMWQTNCEFLLLKLDRIVLKKSTF